MPATEDQAQAVEVDGRRRQRAKSAATRNRLLDAAADVVTTDGIAGLTLERVAEEAGTSKGGLLYHFASKRDLIMALAERALAETDATLEDLARASGRSTGAFAAGYLDFVTSGQHAETDSAASIFAAAAHDQEYLAPSQAQFDRWQQRLLADDGIDPTLGLLARVVGDGLWLIDLFGLAPPDADQRRRLADVVMGLIDEPAAPRS